MARGDVDGAALEPADRALLTYAAKLTLTPAAVAADDLAALRAEGFDDPQLWEATFTTAFFNLLTRMADAFGIVPLPEWERAVGLSTPADARPAS